MSVRVACPGCGGAVVFTVGSAAVVVCPHCRSAVARGDRSVEDLGKVADLADTGAVLRAGLEGAFDGVKFRLTGRTQLNHPAGGVWDEWYAAFADGRWGWLAEAQGRYTLLFEQPDAGADVPEYRTIAPGDRLTVAGAEWVVAEAAVANPAAAEGELPYRLEPGRRFAYADLSGPGGAFATVDYGSDPPAVYAGREVTLDELRVPVAKPAAVHELRQVAGTKLSCPNCGGGLELRAPDQTERVGCPYCGSLLDATSGDLKLLQKLKKPKFPLHLELGAKGTFADGERTVIGAFRRSVTFDKDYFWTEYLLYHPRDGFEWLVHSDGHWTRVKNVPAGDVKMYPKSAHLRGQKFRKFQQAEATVRAVVGESYWKVTVGEKAQTADFVRPPEMLSVEESEINGAKEQIWSHGTYLTPAEVQQAFRLEKPLPAPEGVGPNQPFRLGGVYKVALWAVGLLVLSGCFVCLRAPDRKVYEGTFSLPVGPPVAAAVVPPGTPPPPANADVFFTDLFELKGRQNVWVKVDYPALDGWLALEADLVRQADGEVQPVVIPLTYYHGVEDGEAWTEGSKSGAQFVTAQPPGTYSLRLEVERENRLAGGPLTVAVYQGVGNFGMWALTLGLLLAVPAGVGLYHLTFSYRRWQTSDYSPYGN